MIEALEQEGLKNELFWWNFPHFFKGLQGYSNWSTCFILFSHFYCLTKYAVAQNKKLFFPSHQAISKLQFCFAQLPKIVQNWVCVQNLRMYLSFQGETSLYTLNDLQNSSIILVIQENSAVFLKTPFSCDN